MSVIRIGVSACLLGQEVRFDGGHKRDAFLTETLAPHVEWVPVCPEAPAAAASERSESSRASGGGAPRAVKAEVGMGTPREPLRLIRDNGRTRMVTTRTAIDYTKTMNAWAKRRLDELEREDLDGYVLKNDSPSCGMERVKVYRGEEPAVRDGRGLFAEALLARLPLLPVEDEGRLADARLREHFLERVFTFRRLKDLFRGEWTIESLIRFHTAHTAALHARSKAADGLLGRIIAEGVRWARPELRQRYEKLFMTTLALPSTTSRRSSAVERIELMLRNHV